MYDFKGFRINGTIHVLKAAIYRHHLRYGSIKHPTTEAMAPKTGTRAMTHLHPLRTEADYDNALAAIAPYFLAEPALCSPAAARFDDLAALIAAYEAVHWAIAPEGETGGA